MSKTVIKVENLSKQYRLGSVSTGALSHDINRWWHRVRGKENPYLKVGEVNDRSARGNSDYVWALRDISFEVKQGEVLGIIGRNGAGKSTLLKILSRTTAPTSGQVKLKGRVASLLEVGTGFHPELSGRENIYLNGALLGMTRAEISHKFDQIIDFAGVERFIDTPVKRYSSGMYVRLAFAVAAHLEPEILIVDEVLAVGDAEFQKKCLGKMKDVSEREGRTVLFVSHNIGAIKSLCSRALMIKNGEMEFDGAVEKAVSYYLKNTSKKCFTDLAKRTDREGNGQFQFTGVTVKNKDGEISDSIFCNESVALYLSFRYKEIDVSKMVITVGIKDNTGELIAFFASDEMGYQLEKGAQSVMLEIPNIGLRPGEYSIWLLAAYIAPIPSNFCDVIDHAANFVIHPIDFWNSGKMLRNRNTAFFDGRFVRPTV